MRRLILLTILAAGLLPAQTGNAWEPLEFLPGTWKAESDNQIGSSYGSTTFKFDVQKQIVVRPTSRSTPKASSRERATTT